MLVPMVLAMRVVRKEHGCVSVSGRGMKRNDSDSVAWYRVGWRGTCRVRSICVICNGSNGHDGVERKEGEITIFAEMIASS